MGYLEAMEGEGDLALDECPSEAHVADVLEILEAVHAEGVQAVMAGERPRFLRGVGSGYAARPRSGPVED